MAANLTTTYICLPNSGPFGVVKIQGGGGNAPPIKISLLTGHLSENVWTYMWATLIATVLSTYNCGQRRKNKTCPT